MYDKIKRYFDKHKPYIYIIALAGLFILTAAGCANTNILELSGTIESTQIDTGPEVTGKVVEINADEGDKVKKGDVLAVLDSSMQELVVKQQEAVVKLKQAHLDELLAGTQPEQLEQAEDAVKMASLSAANAQTGVDTAQTGYNYWLEKYNNAKDLYSSNSVSENDLLDAKYKADTAKQQLDVAEKQLESANSQLQSANSQLHLLQKGSTDQAIEAAKADLEQSQAALDQAKLTLTRYEIKAPADGTLILKNVEIGDMVNTGAGIFTISDLDNLWVSVYIRQKYLNKISLNQNINLKVKALGNSAVKGKVIYIASEAEFTPKNTETDESKENTVFKVKIKIMERTGELKPGMTADAIIPLT